MAYVAVSASPIRVRQVSGGHPDQGLPGSEYPDQGLPGAPDQGLPPYPDQGLPPAPTWPPPTVSHPIVPAPPDVPPGAIWPPIPSHPIYEPPTSPGSPDQGLPQPPGVPTHPIAGSDTFWVVCGIPGYGWRYICVDPSLRPTHPMAPGHEHPDQGLPPEAQPKR